MQIHRLRLVNFRQHEDTELALGAGLTGIVGANGAGKSTLLEAIAFAIYGVPAVRGTRDSIRRRGAPPRAQVKVEMDFDLGPHTFRVVRGLTTAELFQDGDRDPVANSIKAVTEKLTRLLGMKQEEFYNTYFTGQKELAVMGKMSGAERGRFLSQVLGYEKLRTAQELLGERRKALRAQVQAALAGLPDVTELEAEERRVADLSSSATERERVAQESLVRATASLAEVAPRLNAMQELRRRVHSLEGDIRVAEHQVTNSQERTQDLDRQIAEALQAKAHLEAMAGELAPLAALRAEQEALQARFAADSHRATIHGRLESERANLRELDRQVAALPTASLVEGARTAAQAAREAAMAATAQTDQAHTTWVRDQTDAATRHRALQDQYVELRQQLKRITAAGADGACPTCARPLGADFASVLGLLGRQAEEVELNGKFYRQRVEQLHREPAELTQLRRAQAASERAVTEAADTLARLEAQLREAAGLQERRVTVARGIAEQEAALTVAEGTYDPERHAEVRRLLADLDQKALQAERFRALADRAARLAPELLAAEQAVSQKEEALKALRHQREELGFAEPEFEAVQAQVTAVEEERRRAELGVVASRGDRAAAEEAARAASQRRSEREAREREARLLEVRLSTAEELNRALSDLRTDLNAALRPDLSELASGFLRDLTDGRYTDLELNEDYEAAIVEEGEAKAVISGGEEDVASLALRLAISQMIAERAGQPLSLLVLDEIFGSLDEERRAAVMDLLRGLADRFPQVILITHIEGVREGFDRVIRVERDPERRVAVARDELLPGGDRDVAA